MLPTYHFSRSPHQFFCIFAALLLFTVLTVSRPDAQEVGEFATVDTLRLNLRSGPGAENSVIREMPQGTVLRIKSRNEGWVHVELEEDDGVTGWTSARYLKVLSASMPEDPETFFSQLEAEHGTPDGRGFLPKLNTHFAYYCGSRTGLGIALYRPAEPAAQVWTRDDWCVSRVAAVDLERDGEMEIVYNTQGGGTGTFGVAENILHWPMNATAPNPGFEYTTLQADTIATPFDLAMELITMREMRYGEDCRVEDYCPSWPSDAECRSVTACNMTEVKEMRVAAPVFPERLRTDLEWRAFIKSYEQKGFVLLGDEAVEGLNDLILDDLSTLDDGTRPELTAARKALIDSWLN